MINGTCTLTQQNMVDRILATFGGRIEKQRMIGLKLWLSVKGEHNWIHGTIDIDGSPCLTVLCLGSVGSSKYDEWLIAMSDYKRVMQ